MAATSIASQVFRPAIPSTIQTRNLAISRKMDRWAWLRTRSVFDAMEFKTLVLTVRDHTLLIAGSCTWIEISVSPAVTLERYF